MVTSRRYPFFHPSPTRAPDDRAFDEHCSHRNTDDDGRRRRRIPLDSFPVRWIHSGPQLRRSSPSCCGEGALPTALVRGRDKQVQ